MPPPVHLRVHGHHSLLTGVDSPQALLLCAADLGYDTLALTDIDTGCGLVAFAQAAAQLGIHPIFGAELSDPQGRPGRIVALVESELGYANLCRLLSIRALGGDPGRSGAQLAGPTAARLAHECAAHAEGLIFLADHPRTLLELYGRVGTHQLYAAISSAALSVKNTRHPPATRPARHVDFEPETWERARSDEERLDLPKPPAPDRPMTAQELIDAARSLGVATVAAPDVHCARPSGWHSQRLRTAVKHAALLEDLPEEWCAPRPCHLHAPAEFTALYAPIDAQAVDRTRELADRCRWIPKLGRTLFPTLDLPTNETAYSRLATMAFAGAAQRYRPLKPEVVRRLDHELATIDTLGYAAYFLLVESIAAFARERNIPCVGRGSAADSLTAYCLGLTDADPLRYELVFERFLNPARRDRPDIDLDFCWRRRDEVLNHVYTLFGSTRTAMIATIATCGPRAALREAALAEGLPPALIARWTRQLPWSVDTGEEAHDGSADSSSTLDTSPATGSPAGAITAALRAAARTQELPWDEPRFTRAAAAADALVGAPRFFGLHPGGVVVAPQAISSLAPCARSKKGHLVVQYDKDAVEAIGLVKMDLLGNRALTVLDDCTKALQARGIRRDGQSIQLQDLNEEDPATARSLSEGRTLACFQVESPGMRHLLQQMNARTMDHVIQAVALIRPGPAGSGMKDAYIRRARGAEEAHAPHPRLAQALRLTHGVLLYQEDVMVAASLLAGMDLAEADLLRRALQKRRDDELPGLRRRFLEGCAEQTIAAHDAQRAWELIANFASFGFCKAHAVTYGRIAYRAVWLKTHFPAEYMAAFLSSDTGYYDTRVYVEEARRLGARILGPCVNHSGQQWLVERSRHARAADGLRLPLSQVKGISQRALEALHAARQEGGAFVSLPDLASRVPLERDELEALVRCGACACFDRTIPELLWRVKLLYAPERRPTADLDLRAGWRGAGLGLGRATLEPGDSVTLFPEPAPSTLALPRLPDYNRIERGRVEHELLGVSIEAHPTELFPCAAELKAEREGRTLRPAIACADVRRFAGARVAIRGWLAASRSTSAADGRTMKFLTLEDSSGLAEVVVFPDIYTRDAAQLAAGGVLRVVGVVDERYGSCTLQAERIE